MAQHGSEMSQRIYADDLVIEALLCVVHVFHACLRSCWMLAGEAQPEHRRDPQQDQPQASGS